MTGGKVVKTFKSRDVHTEGIVFEKSIKDKQERKLYSKKFFMSSPFIPLKDPFQKVRNLDLPFGTDVMNAEVFWTARDPLERFPAREPFKAYALIGLPKVKTIEERKKSHSRANEIPDGFERKVPMWKKMLDNEYNFIFKGVH